MEVRHQSVDRLEPVSWPDDEVGLAGAWPDAPVRVGALERPDRGGSDGNHPLAPRPSLRVGLGSFLGDKEGLFRDAVIVDVVGVDARERPRADVKDDFVDEHASGSEGVEQIVREVEAGGRGSDASRLLGVDSLIPLTVERAVGPIDVRGEGKMADPLEDIEDFGFTLETHGSGAIGVDGDDSADGVVVQPYLGTRVELAARTHQRAELVWICGFWEEVEHLGSSSSSRLAEKPSGQDAASVDDQQVAFLQMRRKGGELTVRQRARLAAHDEESRGIPVWERGLRDQVGGQVKVEVLGLQKSFFWGRSPSGRSRPKCLYARWVAIRPRGVRSMKPI